MESKLVLELIQRIRAKVFLRAFLWLVLLLALVSALPWTRGLYDHIFPRPELRITEANLAQATRVRNEGQFQRQAIVENRGNGAAERVFITASVPGGRIAKYEVFADHPYKVHENTNTARGYLVFALDRLSPGARVVVFLWGAQAGDLQGERIFAAVYDAGSAPHTAEPSSEEQIRGNLAALLAGLQESAAWAAARVVAQTDLLDDASSFLCPALPIPEVPTHLVISALTIAFFAWLLLDSTTAALVHGGLSAFISWLLLPELGIPRSIIALCPLLFFLLLALKAESFFLLLRLSVELFLPTGWKASWDKPLDVPSRRMLSFSVLFLLLVLVDRWGGWPALHPAMAYLTIGYLVTMLSLKLL